MMPRKLLILQVIVFLCSMLITAFAHAKDSVLRGNIEVNDSIVTLGDLVENAGKLSSKPMFRAPDPGTTGTLDTRELLAQLQKEGLFNVLAYSDKVVITRPGKVFNDKDVRTTLARKLKSTYALDADIEDIQISLNKTAPEFMMPANIDDAPIQGLQYSKDTGRFSAWLSMPNGENVIPLKGIALVTMAVPVPTRNIVNGEIISASDFRIDRLNRSEITANVLTDITRVVGMAARRPLYAGRAIAESDFTKPIYVERNAPILMSYKAPGIAVAIKGKALGTGSMGDVVSVQNINSKKIIQAKVIGPQHVEILSEPLSLTPRVIKSAEIVR